MKTRQFFHFFRVSLFLLSIIQISGCGSLLVPKYSDVIYNNRQPLISVTYEYGEIEVRLPLVYLGAKPNILAFQVYSYGDTTQPIISILQEATSEFRVYLPQGVLDINEPTNLIKITPQNPEFETSFVRFKGIRFGSIQLPPKLVRMRPIIVTGTVFLNRDGRHLPGVDVSLKNFDQMIHEVQTDTSGIFMISIPGEYSKADYLQLVGGENLIFKSYRNKLIIKDLFELNIDIGIGPGPGLDEPIYLTNHENVHFRGDPDIGSKTLFLLEEGEPVSVQRVTPSEYFGTIEVELESRKKIKMEGWILRNDLKLLNFNNLFRLEDNYESNL